MQFRHLPVTSVQDTTRNLEQLQGVLPRLVTTLPPVASDGQVVDFQNAAMAASGVVWRLRYRAASASTHKWEFVGGSDLVSPYYAGPEAGCTTSGTAFQFVAYEPGAAPTLTVPLAGDYDLGVEAVVVVRSAGETGGYLGVVNRNIPSELFTAGGFSYFAGASLDYKQQTDALRHTLAANTVITPGVAASIKEAKIQLYGNLMKLRPVRVG